MCQSERNSHRNGANKQWWLIKCMVKWLSQARKMLLLGQELSLWWPFMSRHQRSSNTKYSLTESCWIGNVKKKMFNTNKMFECFFFLFCMNFIWFGWFSCDIEAWIFTIEEWFKWHKKAELKVCRGLQIKRTKHTKKREKKEGEKIRYRMSSNYPNTTNACTPWFYVIYPFIHWKPNTTTTLTTTVAEEKNK